MTALLETPMATQARTVERVDPKLNEELDHVAYMQQEGILPKSGILKKIGQRPGIEIALEQRLKDRLDSARDSSTSETILGVLETARLFPLLEIKVPDQYRSTLPTLVRQCEKHLDAQGIAHKPKQRGVVRRRIVQSGGAIAGVGALIGAGRVATQLIGYGKHTSADIAASPYNIKRSEATATSEPEINKFADLIAPLIDYAQQQRAERLKRDPEYAKRIDPELASRYLTFSTLTYWEEHGFPYYDMRGAITLFAYDTRTNKLAQISFSRDTRTPEIEQFLKNKGVKDVPPQGMGLVLKIGGMDLMRKVVEDMTGLPVDFQFVLKDTVLRDLVTEVTGPLEMSLPKEFETGSWKLDGKDMDLEGSHIPSGKQVLDATGVMRLILADNVDPQVKSDERSQRKNVALKAIKDKVVEKIKTNPFVAASLLTFFSSRLARSSFTKEMMIDFEWSILNNIFGAIPKALSQRKNIEFPDIDSEKVFAFNDPRFGDGGVIRVHDLKTKEIYDQSSPSMQRDAAIYQREETRLIEQGYDATEIDKRLTEAGSMPRWMLVANEGDPYSSNLPRDYWPATRRLTKERLMPITEVG